MSVHLFSRSYFLLRAEDADHFIHQASVWFNAAISSSESWADVEKGSGFVGVDRINEHCRFDFGNCRLFKFWGFRKKPENANDAIPPFALNLAVIKRLGQAMITVTIANGHLVPFVCCAWGMFEHWMRAYPSIQAIDEQMLLFRRVVTQCRLTIGLTVVERSERSPVLYQSLLKDGLLLSEFGGMSEYSKRKLKASIPQGMVFADQLVKVMPKEYLGNIDQCRKSYESCYQLPLHLGELLCNEREARDFMAAVSKRLTILSMSPIQSNINELRKSEVARRELKGLKHKSKRKRTDLLRTRTQAMLVRGDMNNLDDEGRLIDVDVADADYAPATQSIVKKERSCITSDLGSRARKRRQKTVFDLHLELIQEQKRREVPEPLNRFIEDYEVENSYHSQVTLNSEDFMVLQSRVDVSLFFDEWDRRMTIREEKEQEEERLKTEIESLSQIKWELEDRVQSLEEQLRTTELSLREQKQLNEYLSETLSERPPQSGHEDLSLMAMLVAEPTHNISASEALRTAEILSAGRLVVLPSARKSAEEVPSAFQSGTRLLQLLMRLSQLWLPQFLESGDAVARNVFTNNTYSAKETRVLQNTKRLVQARTFKYRGREIPMMKHLCIGVKRDTSKTLRVYFEADQEEGKVIVGWCGEHLPVACRLART